MSSAYRHVTSNDGHDWPVNSASCLIPEKIENIREAYGITIPVNEALRPGGTSFKDFGENKIAILWEICFQLFLILGESLKQRLRSIINQLGGAIDECDVIQFYIEPVLDEQKYIEDNGTSYCKTSAVAYTFWIFIKDMQRNADYFFDVKKMFAKILDIAMEHAAKLGGDNNKWSTYFAKEKEDKDDEEDNKKGREKRPELSTLPKHERWKLFCDIAMAAHMFDLMMQKEEWQTSRLDVLVHKYSEVKANPANPKCLFSPITAYYARPTNCIKNQQIWNIDKVFVPVLDNQNRPTQIFNVFFPMRSYVYKISIPMFTLQNVISKKLLLYQLNSVFQMTKLLPIILMEIEDKIDEVPNAASLEASSKKYLGNKGTIAWDSSYQEYQKVLRYIADPRYEDYNDVKEPEDPEKREDLNDFRAEAMKIYLGSGMGSKDFTVEKVQKARNERKLAEHREAFVPVSQSLTRLADIAKRFNQEDLFRDALVKNKGRINKLIQSQLVNCTTLWPTGADLRDNAQDDSHKFISIYAMLEAQYAVGKKAIATIAERINNETLSVDKMRNPTEVKRKLLLILKRHMLKEYSLKCMSSDAYGLSPYEKGILYWQEDNNPFNMKITFNKIDQELGIFSNMEARIYMRINSILNVASMQRPLALGLKYALDANRLELDLHLNLALFSPNGGNGKSNVTEKVQDCSILNTVRPEAYKSTRGDMTNERNMNSAVLLWPEMSQAMLDDSDPKNEQARLLKDKISSGISTGTRLQKQEDGSFKQDFIYSEQISVILTTTNIPLWDLSGPMKSRLHLIAIEDDTDPFRTILEAKAAEKLSGEHFTLAQARFKDEHKFTQWMIFHIERMIKVGVLTNVTCDIGWVFMIVLQRLLKAKGILMNNVRIPYCLVVLARQNCIREAIARNWLQKGAPYNGKPIKLEQFMDLDPMLFLTTEHIVGAIGEAYDRIINPAVDVTRRALRALFYQNASGRFRRTELPSKSVGKGVQPEIRCTIDYSWARFMFNEPEQFYKRVSSASYSLGGATVSPEGVKNVINGWFDCRIKARRYAYKGRMDWNTVTDNWGDLQDQEIEDVIPVTGEEEIDMPIVEAKGKMIYINYHFLKEENPRSSLDELKECVVDILSCAHQLSGNFVFTNNPKFPFVREVIKITENNTRLISIPSLNWVKDEVRRAIEDTDFARAADQNSDMTEGMEMTDHTVTSFGHDLNTISMKKRNKELYITTKPINGNFARFNLFSGTIRGSLDLENMSELKKQALCFGENRKYVKESLGYFMGEQLDHLMKAENAFDPQEMFANLLEYYKILDQVDMRGDDEDFNPEQYIISRHPDIDTGEMVSTYHWETLSDRLQNPAIYKLMRHHPKVANDFFNKINNTCNIPSGTYPQNIIKEYKEAKEEQPTIIKEALLDDTKKLALYNRKKKQTIQGYVRVETDDGEIMKIDEDDEYRSVEIWSSQTKSKLVTKLKQQSELLRQKRTESRDSKRIAKKYKPSKH